MVLWSEVMHFTCSIYNLMNSGVAEFNDFPGFNINQVIMLSALVCSFKLRNVFPELMLDNQVTLEE